MLIAASAAVSLNDSTYHKSVIRLIGCNEYLRELPTSYIDCVYHGESIYIFFYFLFLLNLLRRLLKASSDSFYYLKMIFQQLLNRVVILTCIYAK